jgi:hypothetical protein
MVLVGNGIVYTYVRSTRMTSMIDEAATSVFDPREAGRLKGKILPPSARLSDVLTRLHIRANLTLVMPEAPSNSPPSRSRFHASLREYDTYPPAGPQQRVFESSPEVQLARKTVPLSGVCCWKPYRPQGSGQFVTPGTLYCRFTSGITGDWWGFGASYFLL